MNGNYPYGAMGPDGQHDEEARHRYDWQHQRMGWRQQRGAGRDEWPDRPSWRPADGLRNQESYGAPDRQRQRDYNPGYEDQDYSMGRDSDRSREHDDGGWRSGAARHGGARGNWESRGYRSGPPRGNWGSADHGGDYRGATSDGARYGEWAGRDHWGQQGYGQPYSHRDWGERDYHRESRSWQDGAGWDERGLGDYGGQDYGGRNYGGHDQDLHDLGSRGRGQQFDPSRSSQGNRRYPGLAGAYTGETHGREWGAFGGAGWGDSGRDEQGGRHHRGRGPKGYERSDERIQEEICERLTHDPLTDASDITVQCRAGVVTLEGSIERRTLKHRVEDMVAAVTGVRDVQNRLTVQSHGMATHSDSQPRSGEDSRSGQGEAASHGTTGGISTGSPAETRTAQVTTGGNSTLRQ